MDLNLSVPSQNLSITTSGTNLALSVPEQVLLTPDSAASQALSISVQDQTLGVLYVAGNKGDQGPQGPPGPRGSGITSLNGLTGDINIYGTGGNLFVITVAPNRIYISGSGLANSGDLLALSGYLSNQIAASGSSLYSLITGVSGFAANSAALSGYVTGQLAALSGYVVQQDSVLSARIESTGQTLYNLYTGISGGNAVALSGYVTGQIAALSGYVNAQDTILSGQNSASGSILYGLITGLSGQAQSDYATKTSLYQTGSYLYGLITGVSGNLSSSIAALSGQLSGQNAVLSGLITGASGALNTSIIATGNAVVSHANGIGTNLSGALAQTGAALDAKIDALSGFATGLSGALQVQINSLPTSGTVQSTGQQLYALLTGLSGQAQIDYATKTQLTQTGVDLGNRITALSGFTTGISGSLNGLIIQTGNAAVSHANSIGQTISGNVAQTGAALNGRINSLSGYVDSQDYATGRAAILYASGISGVLNTTIIATGNTAVAHANSIGATISGNLTASGSTLNSRINALSGWTDQTFVHRTGYELISGIKQFVSSPILTGIQFLGASGSGLFASVQTNGTLSFASSSGSILDIQTSLTGSLFAVTDSYDLPVLDVYSDGKIVLGSYLTNTLIVSGSGVSMGANYVPPGYRLFISGDTQYVGNLFSGSLGGQVTNIADLFYPRQSNPSGYLTGLPGTGNLASIAQLNSLSGFTTGVSGSLHNRIISTGNLLYSLITGLSGATNTSIANTSGVLDQRLFATGSGLYDAITGMGNALSGQLTTTGQTLYGQTTGLSGYLIGLISATSAGVTALNGKSGIVDIYGTGTIAVFTQGQTIWVSGTLDAGAYATVVWVTGISGYLQNQIIATGNKAISHANGVGINLSGQLALTGSGLYGLITGLSGQMTGDYATKTQLTQTGVDLGARISVLSGYVDAQDYATGRAAILYASGSSGALNTTISATGNSVINHANGIGVNLSGALTQTGVLLGGQITSLSGFVTGISGALQTAIDGLGNASGFITTGQTGQFYPASNPRGYATSGDLATTGSNLYILLTGFSGQSFLDYATKTQLTQTGVDLGARITSLSGYVDSQDYATGRAAILYASGISGVLNVAIISTGNAAVTHANSIGQTLSGNLTLTGQTLQGRIDALSGHVNSQDYATGRAAILYASGLSGALNTALIATGNAAISYANSIGSNVSGTITQTGAVLYAYVTGNSGALIQSGSTLNNRINALSGYAEGIYVHRTGNELISGQKQLVTSPILTGIQFLGTSGSGIFLNVGTGGRVQFNSGDNLILSIDGFNSGAQLSVVDAYEAPLFEVFSDSRVVAGQFLSYALFVSGSGAAFGVGYVSPNRAVLISGDQETRGNIHVTGGVFLSGGIDITNLYYPRNSNPSGFITGLAGTGSLATINQLNSLSGFTTGVSGALNTLINLTGQSTVAHANGVGANLSGNLTQTGVILNGRINSLSGYVDSQDYATGRAAVLYASGISGILNASVIATGNAAVAHANSIGSTISGNLTATGATLQGRIAFLSGFVGQVSGGLEARIAQTGQAAFLATSGASGVLALSTYQTGATFFALLTGMSGQGATDYATKTQLTLTGQTLQGRIDSLSGYVGLISGGLEVRITATGNAAVAHANGIGINLSGQLAQTGATLIARDNSISGVLQGYIDSISAGTGIILRDVVYTSGTQYISGTKYFIGNTYIDNLYVTGKQIVVNTQDVYVGNNWMVLNATGGARDSAIFVSTGFTGINATGGIIGFDVPSNTWRFGLGGYLTDLASLPVIASVTDIVNASGGLEARIVQTGAAAVAYANTIGLNLSGVLAQTGATLISLNLATSGALTGRLYQTGLDLYNRLYNTGQVILAASGGLQAQINATGNSAVNHANGIGVNLSGALTQTGVILGGQIAALSGFVTGFNGGVISYLTGLLPTGFSEYFITHPVLFPTIPRVNVTMELSGDANGMYGVSISGRSTSGFWALLTDSVDTSGVFLDVVAKI